MADAPVPELVMESVYRTRTLLDELKTNMAQFLGSCEADVLSKLTPLQRANALLAVAKSISSLVSCEAVSPFVLVIRSRRWTMADAPVPEAVMESVYRTRTHLDELKTNMAQFLGSCEADVLSELTPLQRASALLAVAKSISSLVSLNLRCNGVNPEEHRVKTELERVSLYGEKVERLVQHNKGPQRPSTTINRSAATRVIGHSLPDLSQVQRKSLRELSQANGRKSRFVDNRVAHKKRKHESSEKQSVSAAAQEFLEKASRELLGDEHGWKGPLRDTSSDEEDGGKI